MAKISIGDIVKINPKWAHKGQKQAIAAWEKRDKARPNFFSIHHPQSSENYQEWFKSLLNSAGFILEIDQDQEWAKVQWHHLDLPLWFRVEYLSKEC
jgi:hypothetical protein